MTGARAIGQIWYRARQFGNVFRAGVTAEEQALLREVLTPPLERLFWTMHPVAQRHHLDVCLHLRREGWRDPDLLAAALLHDLGKGRLGVLERAWIVVVEHLAPGLLRPEAIPPALRRGPLNWLAEQADHAARGAARVAVAGGSPRTVELIRLHDQAVSDDAALDALRRADDTY